MKYRAILFSLGVMLIAGAWANWDRPFERNAEHPWEPLPDGSFGCLIVLPHAMSDPQAHSAQLLLTNYPDKGDKLIVTCETVADD